MNQNLFREFIKIWVKLTQNTTDLRFYDPFFIKSEKSTLGTTNQNFGLIKNLKSFQLPLITPPFNKNNHSQFEYKVITSKK